MSSSTPNTHRALHLLKPGQPFDLTTRPTPTPGPDSLLIKVHSIALNPIDNLSRNFGFAIAHSPAVLGSDIAGTVIAVGPSSTTTTTTNQDFKPGDRILAFAPTFFAKGDPQTGAFQEYALVPTPYVSRIPAALTFNDACTLPMAIQTTWAGWYTLGIVPPHTPPSSSSSSSSSLPSFPGARESSQRFAPQNQHKKGGSRKDSPPEALLLWSAASSMGTAALQTAARTLGYVVYATASRAQHARLRALGASHVFDYGDGDVVAQIARRAKAEQEAGRHGAMRVAYVAAGGVGGAVGVLDVLNPGGGGDGGEEKEEAEGGERAPRAMVASAPLLSAEEEPKYRDAAKGMQVEFLKAPDGEEGRLAFDREVFGRWLGPALEKGIAVGEEKGNKTVQGDGAFVAGTPVRVMEGGLEGVERALDVLAGGVRGEKLVLEIVKE